MENKTKKIWTGVFIIMFLSIIIVVIGATLLYHEHKSFSIIMSVTGVVASIIGIIVTLVQVSSAINKTEAVRTEVTKNSQEIRAFHSIASFNTESEKVRNILDSLSSKEYRYLWWRIAELKDFLIKQKENPVVSNNKKWCELIDAMIIDLGMDVQNLIKKSNNTDYVLDVEAITQHMDKIGNLLAEASGKLENEKYGKSNVS